MLIVDEYDYTIPAAAPKDTRTHQQKRDFESFLDI
jgi:hypothetical protein